MLRKNVKLGKLILGLMLAIFVIGTGPGMTPVVKAADEPAAIKDTYEVDGVTYYNTGSNSFASDSSQFIKETMSGQSSNLAWQVSDTYTYNRSMADLWLEAAGGLLFGKTIYDGINTVAIDKAACSASPSGTQHVGNYYVNTERYPRPSAELRSTDMESPQTAEQYLYEYAGIKGGQSSTGYFKSADDAKPNPTYVAAIKASGGTRTDIVAVYFNNFKIVAMLPEDSGNNYVTNSSDSSADDIVASEITNDTAGTITSTQSYGRNRSWSVSSSISGSQSYSLEESITVSAEFKFGIFEKLGVEAGIKSTQSVENGWSEENAFTDGDEKSLQTEVELPPYTRVMLSTRTTTADYVTRYNCPVGITFDVTIVDYSTNGVNWAIKYDNNARKSLGKRYTEFKGEDDPERTDPDGVHWYYVISPDRTGDTHIGEAMNKASNFVPMSPAGAQFTQKMNEINTEVNGKMPIYPLKKVKADKTSLELPNGASMNIEEINLSGLNEKNAPYYGFDAEKGSWKVINDKQEEITDNAPVEISKDSMTGQVSIKAIAPGTCWLKYEIKEDAYSTAEHPTTFTKNSELDSTAVIKVDVTADYTVKASGSFTGYVDEEPEALDAKGKLRAGVYNKEDIEIDGDIVWEKQEKDGITITDGHLVSFTEPGTYHVRPRCGDKYTDWIEITAKYREYNVTFKYQNGTADKTVAVIKGEKVSKPSASSTACSTFTGWFTDKAGKEAYDFEQPVTKNLTLYAVWKDNHKWSSKYTVDKAATYAAPGSKSIHCTVCNAVKPGSKVVIPKKKVKPTVLKKVAPKKGGFVANWKKGTGINGYVLQYCQNKKFKKGAKKVTIKKAKVVKKAVMKLPAKKKYFVRIRTFKTFKGKKYYSTWSKPKKVKTK